MSHDKGVKALLRRAEDAGAVYAGRTGKGHHKMLWQGRPIFLPSSPSCHRSLKNSEALMRRMGVPL